MFSPNIYRKSHRFPADVDMDYVEKILTNFPAACIKIIPKMAVQYCSAILIPIWRAAENLIRNVITN